MCKLPAGYNVHSQAPLLTKELCRQLEEIRKKNSDYCHACHRHTVDPPEQPIEALFRSFQESSQDPIIDLNAIQHKVNLVIQRLYADLQLLRKLEPQWVGYESWERVKAKREAERARQVHEHQEQAEREQQTFLDAERRMNDAMKEARQERIEEEREERRQANPAAFTDRITLAEKKLQSELLDFRRDNPAGEGDLSHCEVEAAWKSAVS